MTALRLAILGSTRGTDMLALIEAIRHGRLAASIELVISDKNQAQILQRAADNELPSLWIDPHDKSREQFDAEMTRALEDKQIDLIVLIGFMRILSNPFIARWRNRIINVHPSLLPAFSGGMDRNVHQAVLDAKVAETGCTVHFVTEAVDQGPILLQKKCAVSPEDTVDSLKEKVQALEGLALTEVIQHFSSPRQETQKTEVVHE